MNKNIFLLIVLFTSYINAFAINFTVNNITYSVENASATSAMVVEGPSAGIVTIPQTVTYGTKKFTVTALSNCAFVDSYITELYLPSSLIEIRYQDSGGLLHGNLRLERIIVAENNPVFCDMDGVMYSKDLETLIAYPPAHKNGSHYAIPNTVITIEKSAFDGSKNLRTISLPERLQNIQDFAFNGSGIESINIPKSVISLGYMFIRNVWALPFNLKSIHVNWDTPLSLQRTETFSNDIYTKVTLFVPKGKKALYENASIWNNFFSIEEDENSGISETLLGDEDENYIYFDLKGYRVGNRNGLLLRLNKNGRATKFIATQH